MTQTSTASDALENLKTFESWATDYYEPLALRYYDRAIARMLEWLAPVPGAVIFDAGCGTGVHSVRVAKAGYRVRAMDISSAVLETARRRAEQEGVAESIEFEQGDLTSLRFDDNSIDALFSWGVIIHVPKIELAIGELARVLKPGGRMALQVTNCRSMDYTLERTARFVLRKPHAGHEWSEWGIGGWDTMHGGQLFDWRLDIGHLTRFLATLGCRRICRGPAELTELQRKFKSKWIRNGFRRLNSAWFAMKLPAGVANTNLLIFEKGS